MSWREYQTKLEGPRRKRPRKSLRALVVLGAALLFGSLGMSFVPKGEGTSAKIRPQETVATPKAVNPAKPDISQFMSLDDLEQGLTEIRMGKGGLDLTIDLTIDEGIQRFIQKRLARYRSDWAAVAVVDAGSGEVLALASRSEKEPDARGLALRATFPAASIFKIVTAAATLAETELGRNSRIFYDGNLYGIRKRQITRVSGREAMTVSRAFAKSANVVFGKLGAHYVGGKALAAYAFRFGFNVPIPFDLPADPSRAEIPVEDTMGEAKVAAGFGDVKLSPLHGALIAGTIVNGGKMMEPYLVKRVTDSQGKVHFAATQRVWGEPVSLKIARDLKQMMTGTITVGTARRPFRRISRDRILGKLDIGGKTGSLTGKNPKGRTEWFVGYARGPMRKLALAVVTVSQKQWKVKPAVLAKEIFEYSFSSRPVLEASASSMIYGP